MLHALIMAGGSGTRFWPASRDRLPKQLLRLAGQRTMIQATVDRIAGYISPSRIVVLTNEKLVDEVRRQLPELPATQVLGEPCRRDTAPCVGLAAALFAAHDPEAMMLILPADHVIASNAQFHAAIRAGEQLLASDPKRVVTFGIPPSYAAESFGYVERGNSIALDNAQLEAAGKEVSAFDVIRFREKPDRATAMEYVAAGTFYWNSGIFLWKAKTLLDALKEYEPEMAEHLIAIASASGAADFDKVFAERFAAIKGKSIDYAVMEHYKHVTVVESPFSWDDVGSWQAIARLQAADANGNAVSGSHIGIDTNNSIIQSSDGHVVVTIDIDDLIVVHTPDATLVAPKQSEERVREAVKRLKESGLDSLL